MACCLTAPSHYLKQFWLVSDEVLWHSHETSITASAQATILHNEKFTLLKLLPYFPAANGLICHGVPPPEINTRHVIAQKASITLIVKYPKFWSILEAIWLHRCCQCDKISLKYGLNSSSIIFWFHKTSMNPWSKIRFVLILISMTPSGSWFNIKMTSYQYRKSHCGDKTVARSSCLHNGISYTGKMSSLYWTSPLATIFAYHDICLHVHYEAFFYVTCTKPTPRS